MTDWDDGNSVHNSGGFGGGGFGRGSMGRGQSGASEYQMLSTPGRGPRRPDMASVSNSAAGTQQRVGGEFTFGGFGFGLGRARGRTIQSKAPTIGSSNSNWHDSGTPGGFGLPGLGRGAGTAGFGSTKNGDEGFSTTNGNSDFGSSKASGGFGSSTGGGGFGKPGGGDCGFGSTSGGFGRSEDSDIPRGGGFGSRGGFGGGDRKDNSGGGSCYKCGESGHFALNCPSTISKSGGSGNSRTCFKCGEEGHISRECPSSAGGRGSDVCYKCGESGHFSRECTSAGGSGDSTGFGRGRGGGGGGGSGKCFKCDQEGHFAKDCPTATEEEKKREPNYIPPAPSEDEEAIFNSMQRGINFDKYDEIPVECSGADQLTNGISTFDQADLSSTFRENVRKAKYDRPTPVQKWAIPIIRKGRDLMACAQTGSGKTAAFLLPVLTGMVEKNCGGGGMMAAQSPMALIIGPTRELVVQIYNEARKFSRGSMIRTCVVYGGTSVSHQLSELSKGANMVIGTPGRLTDFINRGNISLKDVRYLILDEADRMLDMGFGPEVRKIVEQYGMPSKTERQTLMFSATFPEDIQRLAKEFLNNYLFVTVGRVGSANTDIQQTVHEVAQYGKRDKLVEILNDSGQDRVLVFVETKRQADFIASFLSQSDFPTTSIHGDRLQREREEALSDFKSGKAPILVATSVAARGLDIPGVKHVINYDLPSAIDEYVHRIGRTGRCGNLGKASSFFDPDKNSELARSLVKTLEDAKQEVPTFLETAAEMGTGTGFSGAGGKFGGRDARRGQFNNNDGDGLGSDAFNSGGVAEEESWDD